MIYLCSVYSLDAKEFTPIEAQALMQKRYEYAAMRTALFLKAGVTIFSPINHCHPIARKHDLPRTWTFWKQHDLNFIKASEQLWVLMMPGWEESEGISAEIEYAISIGIRVLYISCEDYSE